MGRQASYACSGVAYSDDLTPLRRSSPGAQLAQFVGAYVRKEVPLLHQPVDLKNIDGPAALGILRIGNIDIDIHALLRQGRYAPPYALAIRLLVRREDNANQKNMPGIWSKN